MLKRLKMGLVDVTIRLIILALLLRFGVPWFQAEMTKALQASFKAAIQPVPVAGTAKPSKH